MTGVEWIKIGIELTILLVLWVLSAFLAKHFIKGARAYFVNSWVFIIAFLIAAILSVFASKLGEITSYLILPFFVLAASNIYWYIKERRRIK